MPRQLLPELHSTPANCAACRRSIRQGSQSFYVASLLLPVAVREPAYAIYAFCRMADDLIDRDLGGAAAIDLLGRMLDRIYSGRPEPSFVERGFADVVDRFGIPRAVPDALIEGLAWDAAGRAYQTFDDLKAYAVRVAGTVGVMMTLAMGQREAHVLARACDLGIAMQLTNIARDIGEDAAGGRLYLPRAWLAERGIDAERWLAAPATSPELRSVVARLIGEAEGLYDRAVSGIAALPAETRLGINAARVLYRQIGHEILRGVDPVTTRAVTTRKQKLRLIVGATWSRAQAAEALHAPCEAQAQFLVDAIGSSARPRPQPAVPPWWDVGARSIRMIDLLNAFSARGAPGGPVRAEPRILLRPSSIAGTER